MRTTRSDAVPAVHGRSSGGPPTRRSHQTGRHGHDVPVSRQAEVPGHAGDLEQPHQRAGRLDHLEGAAPLGDLALGRDQHPQPARVHEADPGEVELERGLARQRVEVVSAAGRPCGRRPRRALRRDTARPRASSRRRGRRRARRGRVAPTFHRAFGHLLRRRGAPVRVAGRAHGSRSPVRSGPSGDEHGARATAVSGPRGAGSSSATLGAPGEGRRPPPGPRAGRGEEGTWATDRRDRCRAGHRRWELEDADAEAVRTRRRAARILGVARSLRAPARHPARRRRPSPCSATPGRSRPGPTASRRPPTPRSPAGRWVPVGAGAPRVGARPAGRRRSWAGRRGCVAERSGPGPAGGTVEVWPGKPYPLGATYDGVGTNFAVFSEVAERGRAVPVRRRRQRDAHRPARDARATSGTATCPASARPALRLPGPRPLRPGPGPLVQPGQAAARPLRQGHRGSGRLGRGRLPVPLRRSRRPRQRRRQRARTCRRSVVVEPVLRLGRRPPAAHAVARDGHLRGAREGLHRPPPRRARGAARHLRRPRAPRRPSTTSTRLGVTAVELLPVHHFVHDTHLVETGSAQLLGLQLDRLLRARTTSTRAGGERGPAGRRSSRRWCSTLHEAGIEVILDVVYNHTAEGNHLGPMLSLQGHRQPRLLPARRRRPALLHGLHGHRQHPEHAPPARAAADHGQPAVLGHRDARRRLPLRPRRHAGPRAARGRPPVGLLRPHPAGPRGQPGEADRRAVGRRRGRLPGGQLPAAVVGVERQVPRHRARLLAGRGRDPRRVRLPLHRQLRPLRVRRAAARSPASTSSPPTTASRWPTSSRTTTSTTRRTARTTATASATTARGTAASRARPTTPTMLELRARQQRNLLATLLLSQGVPMLLGGDEMGRTQQRQQQRLLPGQRDLLVRLGARRRGPAGVHPAARRPSAASTRCSAAAASSRAARSTAPAPDIAWFRPDGAEMTDERLGRRLRPDAARACSTATPSRRPTRAASGSSTTRSSCCSTPTWSRWTSRCPASSFGARWEVVLDTADPGVGTTRAAGVQGRARSWRSRPAPSSCSACAAEDEGRASAPGRRPTASSCGPGYGFDDAAGLVALPGRPRREPPLRVAVPPGGAGSARTATTSSTTTGSAPSWAARRATHALCDALRRARARACCSTSCPTTWPIGDGQRAGGGTCSRTARPACTPRTSTSTGTRPSASCATPCSCPMLGDHYGRVLEPGRARACEREGGAFVVRYHDHRVPVAPRSLDELLGDGRRWTRGSDELAFLADAFGALPHRHRHATARAPSCATATRRCCADLLRRLLERDPAVGARDRRRARERSTPTRYGSTSCSSGRTTGSPTGAPRPTSSTTAASSTSTTLAGAAGRGPEVFDDMHALVAALAARGRRRRAAHRPRRRPARPRGLPGAPAPTRPGRLDRGREDPRAGRATARRVAGRRHHRLRLPRRVGRPVRRPAGAGPLTAAVRRAHRRAPPTSTTLIAGAKRLVLDDSLRRRAEPAHRRCSCRRASDHRRRPRLHPPRAARGAARGRRLLPGVPAYVRPGEPPVARRRRGPRRGRGRRRRRGARDRRRPRALRLRSREVLLGAGRPAPDEVEVAAPASSSSPGR